MMRMTVLASGSKGNSTVLSSSRTRILVDAGLSCRELLKRMYLAGEDPSSIDALLITHEHQDHVQGVAVLARKLGIPVHFTEATHRAWMRWMMPHKRMTYQEWLRKRQQEAELSRSATRNPSAQLQPAVSGAISELASDVRDQVFDSMAGGPHVDSRADTGPAAVPFSDGALLGVLTPETFSEELFDSASFPPSHQDPIRADSPSSQSANSSPANSCKEEPDPCALPSVEYFCAGTPFSIGDIAITPFTIPHDAADPVGFVFEIDGVRVAIATDLGYIPPNVRMALRSSDVLMLESNHDLEMLRDGPYPWSVKQRVLSRVGHLSNEAAAEFLEKNYDGNASYVVLAHLSESNNLPELARVTAERALRDRISLLANRVLLAGQSAPLESICM